MASGLAIFLYGGGVDYGLPVGFLEVRVKLMRILGLYNSLLRGDAAWRTGFPCGQHLQDRA